MRLVTSSWRSAVPRIQSVTILFLLVATAMSAGGGQSIPERVASSQGKPVRIDVFSDVSPVQIEELAKGADLIIEGKLVRRHSYLSGDEKHIYTDYEVVQATVISQQRTSDLSPRPTAPPKTGPIVQLYGGELSVGGSDVTVNDNSRERFANGAEMLLFLTPPDPKTGKRRLYRGSAGAFEIRQDGRLKPLNRAAEPDRWLKDANLEAVIRRIRTLQSR
jgi:hypothetical protein